MSSRLSTDLQTKKTSGIDSKCSFALFSLAALCFLIYSNSFKASWHLDDYQNIANNPRVQIQDIQPSTLFQTFLASPEGKRKPFRSTAFFSFALNAYFGGQNVVGYHWVNITVHSITAFLLFITVLKLFETPRLVRRPQRDAFWIALLTAVLWAANPIQTQAVTYIVQRMTSMAAMFYILGVYCYLSARLAKTTNGKYSLIIGCICSYFLAIMSKENAALLPLALLLVEFTFFRDCRNSKELRLLILLLTVGTALIVVLGAVAFGNPFGFLNGYPHRTFTPFERLLTESRILVHYLSQILYPVPTRLSIYHDIAVSKSLLVPWTTLPSILLILTLVGFGIKWMVSRPLLSFAILFFFVNHLIESTVIGLELVFEHRNYLPSLFVFMPISVWVIRLINSYDRSNMLMRRVLISGVVLLVAGFGVGTYIRNQAWANEKTLWEDTLVKAPNSIRAHHELAYQYYEKSGNYDAALSLYLRGLELNGQNVYEKTRSLNNIASIHFTRGEYAMAEHYWKEAIVSYPNYKQGYYRLALAQIRMGKWTKAAETLSSVIDKEPFDPDGLRLNGIILLHENKPEVAAGYFRKSIRVYPHDWESLMYLGLAFNMTGQGGKANRFYKMAGAERPKEPLIELLRAQNRLTYGNDNDVQSHLDRFIALVGGGRHVKKYWHRITTHYKFIKSPVADMCPLLAETIGEDVCDWPLESKPLFDFPRRMTSAAEPIGGLELSDTDGTRL